MTKKNYNKILAKMIKANMHDFSNQEIIRVFGHEMLDFILSLIDAGLLTKGQLQ